MPCWSLTLAFHSVVPLPFDVARFDTWALAWVGRESSKPGRHKPNVDIWTLHASAEFSQVNVEIDKAHVYTMMHDAFVAMGVEHGVKLVDPIDSHIHKWRFARTENGEGLGFASCDGIGFGGDAFGGSRVEPAYLSGVALAGDFLRRLAVQGPGARHA